MSDPPDSRRGAGWALGDVLAVAVGCAAVWVLLADGGSAPPLLAVVAAAVGSAAAVLAVLAARLGGDLRSRWFAPALVGYGAVLLPWAAVAPGGMPAERVSWLVVQLAVAVLLVLSVRPPRRLGRFGGWVLLAVAGGLAVGALWVPASWITAETVRGLVEGPVPGLLLTSGWLAAAAGQLVGGARRRSAPELRVGLGLAVLAVTQLSPGALEPVFAGLRLLGLVVVLLGLAHGVQRTLAELRGVAWQQQEELAAAALTRERADELAAERDHELRNGLAGLAGITHLLSADGHEHEPLKNAVLAELGRLHLILDGAVGEPGQPDHADPAVDYPVEPVLSGLVMLRRSGGNRVRLRVEPGLRAHGHSAVLAQVVTNLLANCDRHAPGAAVSVDARRSGGKVVIAVRDEGPGLSGRVRGSVLDRGTRDESAGGSGLGLHISRQLIAREGGALTLRSVDDPRGCLAALTVPVAAAERPADTATTTRRAPSSR